MSSASRSGWLLAAPALVLVGAVVVLPATVGLGRTAFSAAADGSVAFVGLQNYLWVLADPRARIAFRNGLVYVVLSAPLSLALGLGLAAVIAAARRRGDLLRLLVLVPWLVSPLSVGLVWRFFLHGRVGLPEYLLGIVGRTLALAPLSNPALALPLAAGVDVWRSGPLLAFLLVPAVRAIPRDLVEQARLDGAGRGAMLWHVWLPWLRPLLGVLLLLRLADALGSFDTPLTLTHGGPGDATVTPALYSYNLAWIGQEWARGLAAAWLLVAIGLVLAVVGLRLARRGGPA